MHCLLSEPTRVIGGRATIPSAAVCGHMERPVEKGVLYANASHAVVAVGSILLCLDRLRDDSGWGRQG